MMESIRLLLVISFLYYNLSLCASLNHEGFALLRFREGVVDDPYGALSDWNDGVGVVDPCLWFGVECSGGKVVVLNLRNLCLGGTVAPDLGDLSHIKSIIFRNNSFYGTIPEKFGELKELEVLDLGFNNFSGRLPSDLGNNLSMTILLLDNNELFDSISPEVHEFNLLSETQVDEKHFYNPEQVFSCNRRSIPWNIAEAGYNSQRRLLAATAPAKKPKQNTGVRFPFQLFLPSPSRSPSPPPFQTPSPSPSPSRSPTPSPSQSPKISPSKAPSSSPVPSVAPNQSLTPPSASSSSPPPLTAISASKHNLALILSAAVGFPAFLLLLAIGTFLWRSNKVATVRPWATGLSGQLQKAFVTGVPKLKRSELESACEDFSNVIGSSSVYTIYKGTLSNGVEIAVASMAMKSAKDWSKNLESQFRKKIDTLSKVNHKNFVNLLGFCEEEEPFTRMIVFEYAPNGTLFEHLHIQEAEHLDWLMRMRIAMGMVYCLEHMHQLKPPIPHKYLNSSSVSLTEDYAAKISDFSLCKETSMPKEPTTESNVYNYGVILFEMMTGRLPYSVANSSLEDWASDYLRGDGPMKEMVDPTLKSYNAEQLEAIGEVIKSCVLPQPSKRPKMKEIATRLREITKLGPDGAIPKISPLWWAELEIMSTEATS